VGLDASNAAAMPGPWGPSTALLDAPSSSLSLAAAPFFPGCSSGGRSKSRRWADNDGEETDDDHPMTYLEAARRPAKLASASPVRPQTVQLQFWGVAEQTLDRGLCKAVLVLNLAVGGGSAPAASERLACSASGWPCPYPPMAWPSWTGLRPQH
jgi:hypothetical protein